MVEQSLDRAVPAVNMEPIVDLARQGAGQARVRAAGVQKKDDAAEAKAVTAEAEKIDRTLGKQRTLEYEGGLAANKAAIAQGTPVARTAAQEKRLHGTNTPCTRFPPEVLARRQRGQLEREFKQRGASAPAAKEAATKIGGRGDDDLGRRAAAAAGSGLNVTQQAVQVQGQLDRRVGEADGPGGRASARRRRSETASGPCKGLKVGQ